MRVNNAHCGSVWSQDFTYDAFGNITKSGSIAWNPGYTQSPPTNRCTLVGTSYDANGNLLNDTFHAYTWDPNWGNVLSVDTVNLTYDALGRMVEQNRSGNYTEMAYGPAGLKALMFAQVISKAFVPLPGGAEAVYTKPGSSVMLTYYRHPDWLGSSRLASTPTRTMYTDQAFAPFGENYAATGTKDLDFTGQIASITDGLYDFTFREYHPKQGRWISHDPAGLGAVDPSNPQSWNRYVYVGNSPLSLIDALGLDCSGGKNNFAAPSGATIVVNVAAPCPPDLPTPERGFPGSPGVGRDFSFIPNPEKGCKYNGGCWSHIKKIIQSLKKVSQCAAPLANTLALNQLTKGTVFQSIGDTVLTNDFSTISNFAFGPDRPNAAINTGISKEISLATRIALETPVDTGKIAIGESGGVGGTLFCQAWRSDRTFG